LVRPRLKGHYTIRIAAVLFLLSAVFTALVTAEAP
jgi:hypothetical protein